MSVLSETVEMLKQFKDFSLFSELGGIIQRLEDKVYTAKSKSASIIHLDKNEKLKGLEHLDVLYQAILKKICLKLTYQSFKARVPTSFTFHPFILKEFNNRWFLVGKEEGAEGIKTLALDRVINIDYDLKVAYENNDFDGDEYYKDIVGVTVLKKEKPVAVVLKIDRYNAPYVLTKPFHASQKLIEKTPGGGVTIELRVHQNFEFERLILGFGDGIEVVKPKGLRNRIAGKMKRALALYEAPK